MSVGHFDETDEGTAITLQFLWNIRIGIEALSEFFSPVLLDLGDDDLLPVFDDEIRLVVGVFSFESFPQRSSGSPARWV